MPVSGLVITLSREPDPRAGALAALSRDARIEVGPPQGQRVPIVVETGDAEEDKDVWRWLHDLEGVLFVDVACIHFDDGPPKQSVGSAKEVDV